MNQDLSAVTKLSRDVAAAGRTLTDAEARFLVDYYYMMQDDRKRSSSQAASLEASGEPNLVLQHLANQCQSLEGQIKRVLDHYTAAHPMGSWMRGVKGIGPVLSAGLLSHLSVRPWRCCAEKHVPGRICHDGHPCTALCGFMVTETVGHWWSFAGLDPSKTWEKGCRRPWNAGLKTLCWKIGQSFMKLSNDEESYYGLMYKQRKAYEQARNTPGNPQLAAAVEAGLKRVGRSTDAYKHYASGVLPPAQIDARARRWVVKLFLAHLHEVWYEKELGKPPAMPYPIAVLGHAHYIPPPSEPHNK